MKRILLLAMVAALMSVMLVMSAAPGFAFQHHCVGRWDFATVSAGDSRDVNGNNFICYRVDKKTGETIYIDDRLF
jgi:hypothetical protein